MKLVDLLSGYADATGATAHPAGRRPAWLCCTTSHQSTEWKLKMHKTTALSTAKAKHYSAFMAGCEFLYLRDLQHRSRFLAEEAYSCIWLQHSVHRVGYNVMGGLERAKHIDIRKHFAHEVVQNGQTQMLLVKVLTASQVANIRTKGLHLQQVLACVDRFSSFVFRPNQSTGPDYFTQWH